MRGKKVPSSGSKRKKLTLPKDTLKDLSTPASSSAKIRAGMKAAYSHTCATWSTCPGGAC